MSTYDARMLMHLRTYRRLLVSEAERLKALAHFADDKHREPILRHLKTIRLATRDLEEAFSRGAVGPVLGSGRPAAHRDASR